MHIRLITARLTLVAVACTLTACRDAPTAPGAPEQIATEALDVRSSSQATASAPLSRTATRLEVLRDALGRVQPTLERDDRAAALAVGLQQAIDALERKDEKHTTRALVSVEQTLQRYSPRDAAMAADLDVIRLAVSAAR